MVKIKPTPPVLSVVIPMRNEQAVINALFARLFPVLNATDETFEIICVNDGSTDETLSLLVALHRKNPVIRIVDLSRSFGKEAALTCGLEHARGDGVIVMDADLQDPPELITDFIATWKTGFQVVYGARRSRDTDSFFKRFTAQQFYALFNRMSDTHIPPDAGDFRLMDRVAVNALLRLPEQSRFMKGMFAWVGFKQTGVPFDRPERVAGESKWPFLTLCKFALDGIFSFSTIPLRIWTWVGSAAAILALIYALFLITRTLIYGIDVPGYASILVTVLFFGGVQLVSTGILGQYIGRIYTASKARPLYVVNQTIGFKNAGGEKTGQNSGKIPPKNKIY